MDKSTVRIVVLDDEPLMSSLIAYLLRSLGFSQISECDNGPAALALVDGAEPPDLILLDLNMPGMDGVEFVRRLVERRYGGRVVLVSGEDLRVLNMVESLIRAHSLNVVGHLSKPFTREALQEMMEKAVRIPGEAPAPRRVYDVDAVRAAIEQDQLVNYYQPVVDVATAALVGVETLVRWQHPEDGLVYPEQFVGVAERHGLIDELCRVVLRNALAQSSRWSAAGLTPRIAVNVVLENLLSTNFVDMLSQEVARAQWAPSDLVLEVIQHHALDDLRAPLEILARLRMKRFRLSLDDFGTGHATLRQLREIPFDELKIDRTFVHGATRDPTVRAIYDASLALGKQLGMTVVAVGVETRQDWELVRNTGCDLAQGYFFGRPMSAQQLLDWIDDWEVRRGLVLGSARNGTG
jgi:EAL domain-containing protein (putative c-di-GMP-specific phosphodiesterase class I)/CheY-like chemotaxis protein